MQTSTPARRQDPAILGTRLSREQAENIVVQMAAKLGLQINGGVASTTAIADAFNQYQAAFNQYQDLVNSIAEENRALEGENEALRKAATEAKGRDGEKSAENEKP